LPDLTQRFAIDMLVLGSDPGENSTPHPPAL
jgi:hypothetical protein